MNKYFLLAVLSVFAASTLYWFVINMNHYTRLVRMKKLISSSRDENEFLETAADTKRVNAFEKRIQKALKMAGWRIKLWQLYGIGFLLTMIFGSGFYLFLHHIVGFFIGAVVGFVMLSMIINAKIIRRKIDFNRSFAIAISVLVKMMRNGIGFEQALNKAVNTSNSFLFKKLFDRFFQEKNRIGEIAAFDNMNNEIDSKELRIFALSVKIGRESGGHFSATLEKVEETLRYRKKMQDKVSVVTREANIGSYMVASLNILLYFMIDANFNGKVSIYFLTSEWGRWQLLGIGLWMIAGLAVNRWITRIEV